MSSSIYVNDLTVSYYGELILDRVSFEIEKGRLVGVVGPNGAGKSTLLKGMLGLIPTDHGTVYFNNQTIQKVRKKIAYVPQRATIDWDFPINVLDTVLLGRYPSLGFFTRPKQADRDIAYECLKKVGMEKFAKRQIGELSGGQQQRVFLARALAMNADLFFLDEPFVGIDITSEEIMIHLLKELRDQGKTVFVVHHDLSKVKDYFDDLVIVNDRQVEVGEVRSILSTQKLKEIFKTQFAVWDVLGVGQI